MHIATDKNDIVEWLRMMLKSIHPPKDIKVWMFGSILNEEVSVGDCDVLILYPTPQLGKVIRLSAAMREEFELHFCIRLHLTRLTYQEAEQFHSFVNPILIDGQGILLYSR